MVKAFVKMIPLIRQRRENLKVTFLFNSILFLTYLILELLDISFVTKLE